MNEGRFGYSGAPVTFFGELTKDMWSGSVADQRGFQINFPTIGSAVTAPSAAPSPQARDATSYLVEDTLTWLKGSHSISMGGSWTQYTLWARNSALLPAIDFDVVSGDPALGLFTTANFPGASSTNVTAARRLYAMLTGRVSRINGDARLNEATGEYDYMGTGIQRARMREAGLFLQDAWRPRPNLTVNAGLRYELQYPFYPLNDSYSTATMADVCGVSGVNAQGRCNLFQPGTLGGKHPQFVNFGKGQPAYNSDMNNIAPSIGAAWTPAARTGLLGALMGREGDFVVRGGYTRSFSRNGLNDFSGPYNANPGVVIQDDERSVARGNLDDGAGLPVLFRQTSRLGPAPFPLTPVYPMTDVVTENVNIFDPDIRVPYADTWTAGIQRGISRNMAVEVRYVGTRSRDSLADAELQRAQHHRERIPRRIPSGAGEPAGQHRGRTREHVRLHRRAGHDAAADPAGLLQRPGRIAGVQRLVLHRRQLDQPDVPELPRGAQPEPVRDGRQRRRHGPARQRSHAAELGERRPAGELLRREPRSAGRRERHHQQREDQLQLAADRAAAAAVGRPAVPEQLRVRQCQDRRISRRSGAISISCGTPAPKGTSRTR